MDTRKLSRTAFEQARRFLEERGRPIDLALYSYHFEDGARERVMTALAEYQNQDGGFGHALEPDLRLRGSSSIATSVAFQIFRQVGARADDAPVRKSVEYLVDSYGAQAGVWPIVPPQADTEPRAPWWDHAKSAEAFGGFKLNPRAELAGYLLDYAPLVDEGLLQTLLVNTMDHVDGMEDAMDMGDFMCCYRLAETESLQASAKLRLWDKLQRAAGLIVERDPSKWSGYATRLPDDHSCRGEKGDDF